MGVSFQFNDTVIKIDRELNTRRNTSFMGNGDKMEQNNDVTLISPPTRCEKWMINKISDYENK